MVDDGDLVGEPVGLVEVLRGQEHGRALLDQTLDDLPQAQATAGVEPGRGLVEEQDGRLGDQGSGEVEAPAHAARVGLDRAVGGFVELEAVEQLVAARLGLPPTRAVEAADHGQVLEPGQVLVDGGVLAGESDLVAQSDGIADDVEADDRSAPGVGLQQRGQDPDDRGLAGAVGPEQTEDRPPPHPQIDALQRPHVAVGLVEARDLDGEIAGRTCRFVLSRSCADPRFHIPHSNESGSSTPGRVV